MKTISSGLIALSISMMSIPAIAEVTSNAAVRVIPTGTAKAGIEVDVYDGYGVFIDFSPSKRKITSVSMVDPTEIRYSGDRSLCPPFKTKTPCTSQPSNWIRFSTGSKLKFPGAQRAPDGSTFVTLITNSSNGTEFYPITLRPKRGKPAYTIIRIN